MARSKIAPCGHYAAQGAAIADLAKQHGLSSHVHVLRASGELWTQGLSKADVDP
jgi:hypothetical protein